MSQQDTLFSQLVSPKIYEAKMKHLTTIKGIVSKCLDWIISASGYAASYGVVLAMLITCYDVVARYAFNSPTMFAYDVSRLMYFYATLLMAPWVFRKDAHIRIDLIFVLMSNKKGRAFLELATSVLVLVACGLLFYQGTVATVEDFVSGMRTNMVIRIPRFLLFMGIPICGFLLSCESIRKTKTKFHELADLLRQSHAPLAGGLAGLHAGNVSVTIFASKELVKQRGMSCGKALKAAAEKVGRRGGGRPDFAQSGWKEADQVDLGLFMDVVREEFVKMLRK